MTDRISKVFTFLDGPHGGIASTNVNCNDGNKARVVFAHGYSASASMTEHAKLFLETAERAAAHQIGSILFDFTGNGLSDGRFTDISPNKRIDEVTFMIDQVTKDYTGKLFLLGFSMGGAISINAASKREDRLSGLVTWSCVPSFDPENPSASWYPKQPDANSSESPGAAFYAERPAKTVGDIYQSLTLPKLQIQGDKDIPFFASEFTKFYEGAKDPKKYILIPEADHIFSTMDTRNTAIRETLDWLVSHL